jgi:hypothetical protein
MVEKERGEGRRGEWSRRREEQGGEGKEGGRM